MIKAGAIRADFAQQARGDFGTCSGQGTKEMVIRMLGKRLFDLGAVGFDLVLELVFLQSTLELIDQGSAFLDQGHVVAAKQPQLGDQRVLFGECFPALPIDAQGIGQTPGVEPVGLAPLGALRAR